MTPEQIDRLMRIHIAKLAGREPDPDDLLITQGEQEGQTGEPVKVKCCDSSA